MDIRAYTLHEHSFRFAGWCAATAAGRSPNCRFTIETGMKILSISGVKEKFQTWDDLPDTENEFDELHKYLTNQIIQAAHSSGIKLKGKKQRFTYGIGAKLLNCYLKPIYLASHQNTLPQSLSKKAALIHPPVDRILLKNCQKFERQHFKDLENISWSTFTKTQYFFTINLIRKFLNNRPLWHIEYYWDGFRL